MLCILSCREKCLVLDLLIRSAVIATQLMDLTTKTLLCLHRWLLDTHTPIRLATTATENKGCCGHDREFLDSLGCAGSVLCFCANNSSFGQL